MEGKLYLDCIDIMDMFDCGKDKALSIIRSVKSVSDTCKIKGKITKPDFDKWYNRPLKKDNAAIANDSIV